MTTVQLPAILSGRIALSIDEAAKVLGVCRVNIYERIKERKLIAHKLGRRTLLRVDEIQALLEGK